jgi:DNA-binding CsgD family transcriptional regulator/tetratricopeptide (TPR) repeat protein
MRLLERGAELETLRGLWAQVRSGRGTLVLIVGEPGAGKTALAQSFVSEVDGGAGASAPVLWGTCTPLATPAPLEPLRDVAHELGSPIAELVDADAPVHRILPALLEALTATSSILVIDDLQWADQATTDLLRLLVRRIHTTRSLVIGTHRDEEAGLDHPVRALVGDIARFDVARQLRVGPLSRTAVAKIVSGRGHDADEVLRLTGGNAFFVHEIAAGSGGGLPATVRDAVLARTAGLTPAAHDVLALMACAPEAVPHAALPALGVDLSTLRSLARTALLDRGQRGLRFRHELYRLAVAQTIPPGGEVALHARMLQVLAEHGDADPAVMTHHAVGAGNTSAVLRYAPEAGCRAAAAGAHRQAAAFFETALSQPMESDDPRRAELLESLATEFYLTDRLPDAIAAATRAMALRAANKDHLALGSIHRTLSLYEWYSANRDRAERHAGAAVELLEPIREAVPLGYAYATEAYLALQRCDFDRFQLHYDRAEALSDKADHAGLRLWLTVMRINGELLHGSRTARETLLDVAAAGFRAELDEHASSGYSNLAYCDVEQRQFTAAADLLRVSLPITVERDLPICHAWQLGARSRLQLLRGDWHEALQDADAVLDSDGVPLGQVWAEIIRGLVVLRRGDADPAEHLDRAWELAVRLREPLRTFPAAAALVEQSWLTGVADPRIDLAVELLPSYAMTRALEWSVGDFAVWLHRVGRPVPDGIPLAEPHRRQLAGDAAGAAAIWAGIGEPYAQALALVDTGVDAEAFRAMELLDRLGATAVAAKVRRDLRDRGLVHVPAGPRPSTRANPAGLTGRQLEILVMLAEGLTNAQLADRLYISPKTVDHHVSAILTKLAAKSRTEAVHLARTSGII